MRVRSEETSEETDDQASPRSIRSSKSTTHSHALQRLIPYVLASL